MTDDVTLDQLRMFIAVVEAGSFSAAGKQVGRVQSAISHGVANLEESLGVTLFDRTPRTPVLTSQGEAMLVVARDALLGMDRLFAQANALDKGLEPEVSIVIDAVFPMPALVELGRRFSQAFPNVPLRLGTEVLSVVSSLVVDKHYQLGIIGPGAPATRALSRRHIGSVQMIPVAAPTHPLAQCIAPIASGRLRRETQIVLSERGPTKGGDFAVLSDRTWRVVDLSTKHALIRGGLGWGNLPETTVQTDIESGKLRRLRIAEWGDNAHQLELSAVYRRDSPPGPAGQALLDILPNLCGLH